ncbi:hypothetical protein [Arthrobacter sp. UYCu712]|uniref:hypothetical protein n=1 Tax=Arthrobacter sp. UYCu712 TaxID=3156340 RepID=UPI00339919AB
MNNPKGRLMIANSCGGIGKGAFAHLPRNESQAIIQPLILEVSVKISRLTALLGASSNHPAQSFEDLAALAWIRQSLEDIEATITGLSEADRCRSAAFQNPVPSSPGTGFPNFRRATGPNGFGPVDQASGLPLSPQFQGHLTTKARAQHPNVSSSP